MRTFSMTLAALAMWVGTAGMASATVYNDVGGTGDIHDDLNDDTSGGTDLVSLEITNNATNLTFTITTAGAPDLTGRFFFLGLRAPGGNKDTDTTNNPFNRNFGADIPGGGMNGTAIAPDNGNNASIWRYNGTSWDFLPPLTLVTFPTANSFSYSVPLGTYGLDPGETMQFSLAVTTDLGNGNAIESIADVITTGNYTTYNTVSSLSYTITPIPEPTGLVAVVGVAAGLLKRRRCTIKF